MFEGLLKVYLHVFKDSAYFQHLSTIKEAIKMNKDTKMNSFKSSKSNRKAMNRNWSNQKANPALKTKAGNK